MIKDITGFKDAHKGADIWVVGSGASLDFIAKDFFMNKSAVALNKTGVRFAGIKYAVCHHYENLEINVKAGINTIAPTHDQGFINLINLNDWVSLKANLKDAKNLFYHDHGARTQDSPYQYEPIGDNALAMGTGIIIAGMSFAEYLGARNIILCGVDNGFIDGKSNFEGQIYGGQYPNNLGEDYGRCYRHDLQVFSDLLRGRGIGIHSFNPFVAFDLEGHKYSSCGKEWGMR